MEGLIAIEDCVELTVRGLKKNVCGSEERLIQATRGDRGDGLEAARVLEKAKKGKRVQGWQESFTWAVFETN